MSNPASGLESGITGCEISPPTPGIKQRMAAASCTEVATLRILYCFACLFPARAGKDK